MKLYKKKTAILMALIIAVSAGTSSAYAGLPVATGDEAMYVNLDYYGKAENVSVVKSYSMNGTKEVVDYGDYTDIINMTNYSQAITQDGKVSFNFDEDVDRFYFEGKMKNNQANLPWNFDVTYKLNGVPVQADTLPGKAGLVEIEIHAIPNPNTNPYYKNNMILQVGTAVNADEVLSLEAPGAQIQSLGNKKAVVFMALPQEEQTFIIRIGSDDFEFAGVEMMMIPVTLSQMEDIKELKETKEKIEDSADAMSDSMDVILDTLDGLQSGFASTVTGLQSLDEARETISNSKGKVYESGDIAAEDLKEFSAAIEPLVPHIDNSKTMLNEVNTSLNTTVSTLKELKPQLNDLSIALEKTQTDVDGLKTMVEEMKANEKDRKEMFTEIVYQMTCISEDMDDLYDNMDDLGKATDDLYKLLWNLPHIDNIPIDTTDIDASALAGAGVSDVAGVYITLSTIQGKLNDIASVVNEDLDEVSTAIEELRGKAYTLTKPLKDLTTTGASVSKTGGDLTDTMAKLTKLTDKYMTSAEDHGDDVVSLLDNADEICGVAGNITDTCQTLIDNVDELNGILNEHEAGMEETAQECSALLTTSVKSLNDTYSFIKTFEEVAKTSGNSLDVGTQKTISGLVQALEESMTGLAQAPVLKNSKDTVKNLIDDEWDKYSEDENGLLNIDTSESPVSFTSSKNIAPKSVQVIVRTQEITKDSVEDDVDLEAMNAKDNGTLLGRIAGIFKKIWSGITGIFS
ncbi:MAG: hypothetical protein AB7E42_04130 [Anaerotignaceae bacterium]